MSVLTLQYAGLSDIHRRMTSWNLESKGKQGKTESDKERKNKSGYKYQKYQQFQGKIVK